MKEIGVKPRKLLLIRIVKANAKMGANNRAKKKEEYLIKGNKEGTLSG